MSKWLTMEAIGSVREAVDGESRAIEGIAVPYGAVSELTDLDGQGRAGKETIRPGAAASSVRYWNERKDGARMPFRSRHGDRPVGAVTLLADTPEGVAFRASIFEGQRGDEYLAEVHAGI